MEQDHEGLKAALQGNIQGSKTYTEPYVSMCLESVQVDTHPLRSHPAAATLPLASSCSPLRVCAPSFL